METRQATYFVVIDCCAQMSELTAQVCGVIQWFGMVLASLVRLAWFAMPECMLKVLTIAQC
jgi:hypothetical protein